MEQRKIFTGCLCALGCETLYGLSYIFTKSATGTASAFALLSWRFIIAVIIMGICIVVGLIKINLRGRNIRPLLIVALFSPVIYFAGETVGISNTTASESGVFLAIIPVASLIASTLILKKKPSKIQVAGILITLFGVVLTVFAVGTSSSLSASGYLCLTVAVISYALYSVFVEKAKDYSESEITFVMLVSGAVVFGILALCEALFKDNVEKLILLPFTDKSFLTAVLYQGIGCSILAFLLNNTAITKIGVNRMSSFIGVSTVVSIIAGALVLNEPFSILQIAGAGVIIAGVYTANLK